MMMVMVMMMGIDMHRKIDRCSNTQFTYLGRYIKTLPYLIFTFLRASVLPYSKLPTYLRLFRPQVKPITFIA